MTDNTFVNILTKLQVLAIKINPKGDVQPDFAKIGFLFWALLTGSLPVLYGYTRDKNDRDIHSYLYSFPK